MFEITRTTTVPMSWAEIKEYAQADKLRELMQLGDELPEIIVLRVIRQNLNGEITETKDALWLPSFTEMFGENDRWAPADTGDIQFQIFTTERSRVKECGDRGTWWYWLRSPYGSNVHRLL